MFGNGLLSALAIPERWGKSVPSIADQSFPTPKAALRAFGADAELTPGKRAPLMDVDLGDGKDGRGRLSSEAHALMPASRDDQFSISIRHGTFSHRSDIMRRPAFQQLVVNFKAETGGDGQQTWRVSDLDYRCTTDMMQPVTLSRSDLGDKGFSRVVDEAAKLVMVGRNTGAEHRMDDHGMEINAVARPAAYDLMNAANDKRDPAPTPVAGAAAA
ncbi:MAG: hypothetical protein AAF556_05840 [Pseudomonadota bacterium]